MLRQDYVVLTSDLVRPLPWPGQHLDNQITNGGYAPDGDGNLTTCQSATLTFDPEDRLTGISSPSFSATYDGDGLRAAKAAGGAATYFLYDGSTPVIEEGFSASSGAATLTALSGWGADGLRSRYYPGSQTSVHDTYDPQGNLVQRVRVWPQSHDSAGGGSDYAQEVLDTAGLDAFGALHGDIDAETGLPETYADPFVFGGQWGYYTDPETGLALLTHRYYDAGIGRFVTRDPIGYGGGINLYGFAGNNPINESDLSGLSPAGDAAGLVGLVPGPVGMAANLVSAEESVREGDYLGASLSVLGEVPALGEIATGAKIARAASKLRRSEKEASEAKTFITYVIKNEKEEVVYVGKTHGVGTPQQVLNKRLQRGHEHYFPERGDLPPEVIAAQGNKASNAGAEDVWYEYYRLNGAKLRNKNMPLDFGRMSRRIKSQAAIRAYSEDLRK